MAQNRIGFQSKKIKSYIRSGPFRDRLSGDDDADDDAVDK